MIKTRNLRTRRDGQADMSCETCAEKKTCERYQENSFCTRWHRRDAEPEGRDPNAVWREGGDAELDG